MNLNEFDKGIETFNNKLSLFVNKERGEEIILYIIFAYKSLVDTQIKTGNEVYLGV